MVSFRTERVNERITRIYGICTELMYLVEGDETAALIDTGSGFGSLKKVVDALTDKPLIVLLTHGHTDHAMGAGEFDTVYMNHEDDYIFGPHGEKAFRLEGLSISEEADAFEEETDYIPTPRLDSMRDLKEGDVFDLGGERIRIFALPGHTIGTVVMLLEKSRILITGDACNNLTFLFQDYSLPVESYRDNLVRLIGLTEGSYDQVFASHGDGRLSPDILGQMVLLCEDVMAGRSDEVPFSFGGDDGLLARETGPDGLRLDGGSGNLVYNKNAILAGKA